MHLLSSRMMGRVVSQLSSGYSCLKFTVSPMGMVETTFCSSQVPLRSQAGQLIRCWESSSSRLVRRASLDRVVLVWMTIPSSQALLQAVTRCWACSSPSTSTTQARQAPISLIPFRKQRVGTGIPMIRVASRMEVPSSTWSAMPLIVTFTIPSFSLL